MSHNVIGKVWFELAGLAFIWIFWISGAGSVSSLTNAYTILFGGLGSGVLPVSSFVP